MLARLLTVLLIVFGCALSGRAQEIPPKWITRILPTYPFELKKAKKTGNAEIEFVVGKDGTVVEAKVLKATHKQFGQSALTAIRKWRFRPGTVDGVPVFWIMRQACVFNDLGQESGASNPEVVGPKPDIPDAG